MNTKGFKVGLITAVFVALIVIVILQQLRAKQLLANAAALRDQVGQLIILQHENQQLLARLRTASQTSQAEMSELLRLRAHSTTIRRLEQENARLKAAREHVTKTNSASTDLSDNPFDLNHGPGASVKVSHAKYWGYALLNYAANNRGRFPATFSEAEPYLHDELSADAKAEALQAAGRYELVFHGSQDELGSLPPESTIIVREKEPWLDPQGRWCKAYCLSDGGATVQNLSRKEDFDGWEALRIPKPKRP